MLGIDFSFQIPASTGETCVSGEVLRCNGESNHFHPEYRKQGETWTMPLLGNQYKAFRNARIAIESAGGSIINASKKTALDVFERVEFDLITHIPD